MPAEAQAEIAAAPEAERPADAKSVTTTLSPAHANKVLEDALGNIFAQGFDERMMAVDARLLEALLRCRRGQDRLPAHGSRACCGKTWSTQKRSLKSTFEPASNQFAQDYGVAGMSEYHVVIGADGKPGEIAVARPIGFGLDESAVDSIRKATFEPAIKDGKPVPVMLNLVVEFRIYSKRTAVETKPTPDKAPDAPAFARTVQRAALACTAASRPCPHKFLAPVTYRPTSDQGRPTRTSRLAVWTPESTRHELLS